MHTHALAPLRSLAFVLLVLSGPSVFAAEARGVTVTEHALPPHEDGTARGLLVRTPYLADERPPWGGVDRALATSYAVFAGLDAWQTGHLPSGYREGNPLVSSWAGDRPSLDHAVAFKAVTTWGTLELARRIDHPGRRRLVLVLMNVVQASVVVLNERKTGGILLGP
jgi:hypothetical protein